MTTLSRHPTRRQLLAALSAAALTPAIAQNSAARRYAVVSLIGDELELVYAHHQTGSLLDRNQRRSVPDAAGAFDKIAAVATSQIIQQRDRGAAVDALGLPPSALHRDPDRLFQGNSVGLPGALVDALTQAKATHLILLTKHKAEASFRLLNSTTGIGQLRGLGYYIDTIKDLRDTTTGAVGTGFMAPYVYLRLTLADVRDGRILAQRNIGATEMYALASHDNQVDPWAVLEPQQKVERLRRLLETELERELPLLVGRP